MMKVVLLMLLGGVLVGTGVGLGWLAFRSTPATAATPSSPVDEFKADSFQLERVYAITVHVPNGEIEKVMAAITAAVPLQYGFYDQVAFLDAPGLEQFRCREGSKGGVQEKSGRAPTTKLSFSIPRDSQGLAKVLTAIHQTHSYEEPVIYVHEAWRSRTTDRGENNPNRWWNQKDQ